MIELAPIVLFTYNRPSHTLMTLKSLQNNLLADQSRLYIFSDGPKSGASIQELNNIETVRRVIEGAKWCGTVKIIKREMNIGLATSIIEGISEVCEKHKKFIVLEDDIITSKYFLKYMNEGLNMYCNSDSIYSISAYNECRTNRVKYPFLLSKGTSWGWGSWKRVWEKVNFNIDFLLEGLKHIDNKEIFNFGGYPYETMLYRQKEGEIDSWGIRFYTWCFLNRGMHITPPESLVVNIGFDGSGTHCGVDNNYRTRLIQNEVSFPEYLNNLTNYCHRLLKKKRKRQIIQQNLYRIYRRISNIFRAA